jgi:hypothetical protein
MQNNPGTGTARDMSPDYYPYMYMYPYWAIVPLGWGVYPASCAAGIPGGALWGAGCGANSSCSAGACAGTCFILTM